ncbi:glycine--tRNA ligase [Candidatus Woesearchaeota archaeon]|nr:glycine--tRNA ligase [Candidatus Woesearchaeota archaeon]
MIALEQFHTFLKKKGFIYPSSEIYGGVSGLYDYGHLGTLLKRNLENTWRNFFLNLDQNYYEIDACQIMHHDVFKASGHIEHFLDPVLNCSKCAFFDRADHFLAENTEEQHLEGLNLKKYDSLIKSHKLKCPKCKSPFQQTKLINMMFPINLGTGQSNTAYLRPETAQSPYVDFKLQYELQRKKLPLGLAIIGKAFRNEISPRNLTLRQREFTQAELQIFFNPENFPTNFKKVENYKLNILLVKDRKTKKTKSLACKSLKKQLPEWYLYHLATVQKFFLETLKIPKEKFRLFELNKEERAFYNKFHFDIEVELNNLGFTEIGGLHYRTDHDLSGHQEVSKQSLEIMDEHNKKFIPHVLEISLGVDRMLYSLLDLAYQENKKRGNVILSLPKKLSPFFCAVFPLVKNKPAITKKAQKVYQDLKTCYSCFYDQTSSVGRRYARADEVGIPYIITVDFDTLKDNKVTIRDLKTTKQTRVKISELKDKLFKLYFS